MSAPTGNNYKMKWKTAKERKAACADLCQHLREGYDYSYYPPASRNTLDRYKKDFPEDFNTDMIDEAYREGILKLQKIGMAGMTGKIKNFGHQTYQFTMINKSKYGKNGQKENEKAEKEIAVNIMMPEGYNPKDFE